MTGIVCVGGKMVFSAGKMNFAGAPNVAPTLNAATASISVSASNGQQVIDLNPSNSPSPSSLTWSFTAGNGDNAFAIDGSTGVITVNNSSLLTIGSRVLSVSVTNGFGEPGTASTTITITAATTLIVPLTLTNGSASAITNEIVEFGFPMSETALPSGRYLSLMNGGSAAGFQVDNISTDMNGAPRLAKITGIISSLGSSATINPEMHNTASAPTTGVAITEADILATEARYLCTAVIDGTTYTVDTDVLLAAGSTFSKTGPWKAPHKWREGPYCTEFVMRCPLMNGATPHASGDGLHVEIHLAAFKAQPGAVSVSNPIIAVYADIEKQNSDMKRASPANLFYGWKIERATSLTDGTLISTDETDVDGNITRYNWPTKTLSASIALSGTALDSTINITLTGDTWDADIKGAHIHNASGAGKATVLSRTSNNVVSCKVYEAFSASSYSSGNWIQHGIMHIYGPGHKDRVWIGQKPKSLIALGNCGNAITPTNSATLAYLKSTKLLLNYDLDISQVTHDMTALNAMTSPGNVVRPFMTLASTYMGDVTIGLGGTGARIDIGPLPGWDVRGLAKLDANGRRKIYENARYFATWNWCAMPQLSGTPAAGSLPVMPRVDSGTNYAWDDSYAGTIIAQPTRLTNSYGFYWDTDYAHQPDCHFVPALLTGDLYWVQRLQAQMEYTNNLSRNSSYYGSGVNKTVFGDATGANSTLFGGGQSREKAWGLRDLLNTVICTPDEDKSTLVNSKSYMTGRVTKTFKAFKTYGPDDILGVSKGEFAFFREPQGSPYSLTVENPWMVNYINMNIGHAFEMGLTTADTASCRDWAGRIISLALTKSGVVRDLYAAAFRHYEKSTDIAQIVSTYDESYQRSCLEGPRTPTELAGFTRKATGAVTLSASGVGTGRTLDIPDSYFGAGAWYVGAYVSDGTGLMKVTSAPLATRLVGDILVAFGSTSPAFANLYLPGPAPADYTGDRAALTAGNDYHQTFAIAARLAHDQGMSGALAQLTWMIARPGYVETDDYRRIKSRQSGT